MDEKDTRGRKSVTGKLRKQRKSEITISRNISIALRERMKRSTYPANLPVFFVVFIVN